jgi:lipopolysaccharide transport system permease protein
MPASPLEVTDRVPVVMLRASRGMSALDLGSLWKFRELLYFLTWRDIKVRYKQTVLGGLWALLQPFLTMVIFSLFFGQLAKMPSDGVPYPLFSYAALVPWTFFTNGLTNASNSLVGSANLITKVYFPRLLVPIASVLSAGVDIALSSLLLFGMMGYYGIGPTTRIVWLPVFVLLAVGSALGAGLWLSALNVQFRDVKYTLPFMTQLWLFATPIAYPSSLLKEPWHTLYGLNPMVGVVEGFRWSLLPGRPVPAAMIELSTVSMIVLLVSGAYYFRRMERVFADVV